MDHHKFEILYEDDYLIIVNKPAGLLVHRYGAHANDHITLMSLVRDHLDKYVYAVNRIDRPVSGIVVFSKAPETVKIIQKYWGTDETIKEYITLAKGDKLEKNILDFSLKDDNGVLKEARTECISLHEFDDTTLYKIKIKSGRKHQIRRHLSRRCRCLVGDTTYGKGIINREYRSKYNLHRIFLHSYKLELPHPITREKLEILCNLPLDLIGLLEEKGLNNEKFYQLVQENNFF